MKKFRLELDDLRIDSFSTTPAQKAKGTVFGEQCTCYTQCTCPGCPTCDASCEGSCGASCDYSCQATCAPASCFETCMWTCGYACQSRHSCDYFTCSGYATDWGGQCVVC
jgi:hypothetical protein